jgi:hypothetical protein
MNPISVAERPSLDHCSESYGNYRDLVIADLVEENHDLREANRQMADLIADLAFENAQLRVLWEREHLSRVHGDATIARLHRLLHRRQEAA